MPADTRENLFMKKNIFRRVGSFLKRNINGINGAISIFLILVISPLLSVALVLVESARYQSAVELVDEIVDASAFSTLADYDSYIEERFDLLALSQQEDFAFDGLLEANIAALGQSATLNSYAAVGKLALSDDDVLRKQILESSEITVVTQLTSVLATAVYEGFGIDDLITELKKKLKIDEIESTLEKTEDVAEVIEDAATIIELIKKISDGYDEYEEAYTAYSTAYSEFKTAYNKVVKYMKLAQEAESEADDEDEGEAADYDSQILSALTTLETKRAAYQSAAEDLKSELDDYSGDISSIISNLSEVFADVNSIDTSADSTLADKLTTSTSEATESVLSTVTDWLSKIDSVTFQTRADEDLQALSTQITALNTTYKNAIKTVRSNVNKGTYSYSSLSITGYGMVTMTAVTSSFISYTNSCLDDLNEEYSVSESQSGTATGLLDLVNALFGISFLADSSLDAVLSASAMSYGQSSGMSSSSQAAVSSLYMLKTACVTCAAGAATLNLVEILAGVAELMIALVEFVYAVIEWAVDIISAIATIAFTDDTFLDNLLLYGYAAYNLSNRTNYSSGSSLTGYSYSKIYSLAGGKSTTTNVVSGFSLNSIMNLTNSYGSSSMFKGAELEYILIGSASEYQNQAASFFYLYLFRILLDFAVILTDTEVTTMAASAGAFSWVVLIAVIIIEPLLETIVLVNGGDAYLINDPIYVVPSGVSLLLRDLNDLTGLDDTIQTTIENSIIGKWGDAEKALTSDSLGNLEYTEYMLLLMMLMLPQSTYLTRMKNIIQTESNTKYSGGFELSEAYTYIYVNVSYTLNPMFDLSSLTGSGLFTVDTQQYIGY